MGFFGVVVCIIWVVVGEGGYILDSGGWLWYILGGGGWWWVVEWFIIAHKK